MNNQEKLRISELAERINTDHTTTSTEFWMNLQQNVEIGRRRIEYP